MVFYFIYLFNVSVFKIFCLFQNLAVRLDRTRGGRSSYDGCSPRSRPKIPVPVKKPKVKRPQSTRSVSLEDINVTLPTGEDVSGSQLMAILNKSGKALLQGIVRPVVPQILSDIVGMESVLCDDEAEADFPMEKISDTDPNVIMSMLQLAELKLYKLVRWARNLPQFSSIAVSCVIGYVVYNKETTCISLFLYTSLFHYSFKVNWYVKYQCIV